MLNRITSSIAICTIFGFIATVLPPLYRTDRVIAQSPRAQDELSKLSSEVFKRGKSPEEVNRAMRDKFPNSSFPYYEPANGCSTPKGISWGWGNNDLFKSACDNHDICYTTPGNPKGYCDRKMLSEMFKICEGGSFLCKSWARDYYSAVNLGAQGAYDTAQKQEGEYIKSVYTWLNSLSDNTQPKQKVDLTGTWIGKGYSCEQGGLSEQVEITINGNYIVAKKITGDNCVPAGDITFQGTLPDSLSEGKPFPVTFTVGNPNNPASGKATAQLRIIDANSLYAVSSTGENITFKRANQSSSNYNRIDLTGNWIGEGYGCERGGLVEKIQITVNGNYIVAKKITGDNCVPAGNVTFQGTLPDLISEGSSFPVTWTVGTPTNPAGGKGVQDLTILNANSFSSYGVKFTRVTR